MSRIDDYEVEDLQPHAGETERIRRRLFRESSRLVLHCCDPIPGYVYQLCWSFVKKDPAPGVDLDQIEYFEDKKNRLLAIAAGAAAQQFSEGGIYARIHRTLEELERHVRQKLGAAGGEIDLSLMAFDEKEKALRVVGASFGDIRDLWKIRLGSGEGCAGFVFEKNRPLFHASSIAADAGLYIGPDEQRRQEGQTGLQDYRRLTSMPWRHPSGLLVGAICAGTRHVRPPGDPVFGTEPEKIQRLWDLLLPYANDILEGV
jgi:hypothetical protein